MLLFFGDGTAKPHSPKSFFKGRSVAENMGTRMSSWISLVVLPQRKWHRYCVADICLMVLALVKSSCLDRPPNNRHLGEMHFTSPYCSWNEECSPEAAEAE